jgi:hypothetical protein
MAEREREALERIALIAASAQGMGNDESARTYALDRIIQEACFALDIKLRLAPVA